MSAPSIDLGALGVAIQGTVLTVIVPTRNEAGNVAALVTRLDAALDDCSTRRSCSSTTATTTQPTRSRCVADLEEAPGAAASTEPQPTAPVGWAERCSPGLRAAHGEWAVVMDGDLQHPPETVPELLRMWECESGADLVVASRYLGCGSAAGLSSAARRSISVSAGRRVTRPSSRSGSPPAPTR